MLLVIGNSISRRWKKKQGGAGQLVLSAVADSQRVCVCVLRETESGLALKVSAFSFFSSVTIIHKKKKKKQKSSEQAVVHVKQRRGRSRSIGRVLSVALDRPGEI